MLQKLIWFLKNDFVFWIFFTILSVVVVAYILKKEDIKITVSFGQTYGNKEIQIFGK